MIIHLIVAITLLRPAHTIVPPDTTDSGVIVIDNYLDSDAACLGTFPDEDHIESCYGGTGAIFLEADSGEFLCCDKRTEAELAALKEVSVRGKYSLRCPPEFECKIVLNNEIVEYGYTKDSKLHCLSSDWTKIGDFLSKKKYLDQSEKGKSLLMPLLESSTYQVAPGYGWSTLCQDFKIQFDCHS